MKNIYEIDALRGVAAFLVVIFHMKPFFEYVIPGNSHLLNGGSYLGVSVFFIISGFVMGASTANDSSIRSFFLKRIFRVYLPTIIAIGIFCLIHKKQVDLIDVLQVIPNGGFAPYYGYGTYFITWTISYEIIFYLIYCLAMKASWTKRSEIAIFLILSNCLLLQLLLTGNLTLNPGGVAQVTTFQIGFINIVASILINPMNLLFVFGLLSFRFFPDFKKLINKIDPATTASVLMLTSVLIVCGYLLIQGHGVLQMGPISMMLFTTCIVLHIIKQRQEISIVMRCFVYLGKISFALYLCHYLAIDLRSHYLPTFIDLRLHPVLVLLAIFAFTLLFYYIIDSPVHKLGNRLAKNYSRRITT